MSSLRLFACWSRDTSRLITTTSIPESVHFIYTLSFHLMCACITDAKSQIDTQQLRTFSLSSGQIRLCCGAYAVYYSDIALKLFSKDLCEVFFFLTSHLVFLRVKEASCPKPATTSESSVRATSDCRRATKRWSESRWTTRCLDNRLTSSFLECTQPELNVHV